MFQHDHEDLLFLHRIDPKYPLADEIGKLKKLQDEGKIKYIGISQVTLAELKEAQKYAKIAVVENLYNVGHHKQDEDLIDYSQQHHIAFLPWVPLNTGKLSREGSPLQDIAARCQVSAAQIALAWLLKRAENILPIPGTSSIAHLEDNLKVAQVNLSTEDFQYLSALEN